jgi:fumarate hydratase class II
MDAVPVTLGQEFGGYAAQVREARRRVEATLTGLGQIPLGAPPPAPG